MFRVQSLRAWLAVVFYIPRESHECPAVKVEHVVVANGGCEIPTKIITLAQFVIGGKSVIADRITSGSPMSIAFGPGRDFSGAGRPACRQGRPQDTARKRGGESEFLLSSRASSYWA